MIGQYNYCVNNLRKTLFKIHKHLFVLSLQQRQITFYEHFKKFFVCRSLQITYFTDFY